jgi:serine phosphatase RsbU (regulator of sigma subunit)
MARDRPQLFGALVAVGVLAVLVGLDMLIPNQYGILTTLFALSPLIACAVIPSKGTAAIGALTVFAALGSGWWNETLGMPQQAVRVLTVVLVSAAAVVISAVRVRREQRFAHMSKVAEVAQRAILPVLPSRVGPVEIAARYQSAGTDAMVGGDLYDCYHSKDHIRLLVGDVRGKGIGGVEQGARVIRAFRQSAALRDTLVEVAEEMDEYLSGFFDEEEFVTALLVEISHEHGLRLVSAGHPRPQLIRSQRARLVDLPSGIPLGLGMRPASGAFAVVDVQWSPGDRLLMYTDGLSEARDATGSFLRIDSLVPHVRSGSVEHAIDEVVGAVTRHVPRGQLDDDLAVVLLENVSASATTALSAAS